jgi:hypothetical protein
VPSEPQLRAGPGLPTALRIRFAEGERPFRFWISGWSGPERAGARYKVLSKQLRDEQVVALVIEERRGGARVPLGQVQIPRDVPAGWLGRWVDTLGTELGVRFESVDLTGVQTVEKWRARARRLGWFGAVHS